MTKLTLSTDAEQALKRIAPKIHAANRYAVRSMSALVSILVIEMEALITPTQVATVAHQLVSPAGRRRALLATLSRVTQTANDRQLKRLESQLQRLEAEPENSGASS